MKRQCYTCKFSEPTNRRSRPAPLPPPNSHYANCTLHDEWKRWDDKCSRWQVESSPCLEYIQSLNATAP